MRLDEAGSGNVFRASELDEATLCARKSGYRRYGTVEKPGPTRTPMNWAMLGGLSMDDALTKHNEELLKGLNGLRGTALTDYFVTRFKENVAKESEVGPIVGEDDPVELKDDGTRVLPVYEREFSPKVVPAAAQLEVSYSLPATFTLREGYDSVSDKNVSFHEKHDEVKLVGHIDLVRVATHTETGSAHKIISDYKFTKKTPSQMPASGYARGFAYDLMGGDGSGHIELIYLRRGLKTPKVEQSSHFVTSAQHQQVKLTLRTTQRMMAARVFPLADPSSWVCSEKWCGWWRACRGRAGGPIPIPGEVAVPTA